MRRIKKQKAVLQKARHPLKENIMKNFLNRFKSWALWVSIAALVVFCVKECAGIDIGTRVDGFLNVLLPVLTAFGIVNNPTDTKSL